MSLATLPLNDGTSIPWIAFGTGTALFGKDASALAEQAIKNGLTHLDGAQLYNNEDTLGDGIVASGVPRESLYVVTKLKQVAAGSSVRSQLEESLKKLKVSYVDLFLVHSPTHHPDLVGVWKQVEEVQKAGLAKSIGVSNFKVEHLKQVIEGGSIVPAVNQIEYHPYVFKAAEPILQFHKEHNIVTASYGGLTPIVRAPDGPLTPVVESIRQRLEKAHGKPVSAGQVLTKWLQQKDIVVVTTSSKVERLQEYLAVPSLPALLPEEVQAIETTGSTFHKRIYMRQIFGDE
ncbi:hypothetical protein PLICRDRAFT_54254 [Plicaturopsis crispa FD-325 SS-3]|nr:hypothetical protein PLICRDRAFT_54254 [Plicaturopsis crispa FD-325 SS-3]